MQIQEVLVKPAQRVPVKIWTDKVDDQSRGQLSNIASLPFIHHHVAAKDIDQVMANQADLTEILHTLKQVVCVKG